MRFGALQRYQPFSGYLKLTSNTTDNTVSKTHPWGQTLKNHHVCLSVPLSMLRLFGKFNSMFILLSMEHNSPLKDNCFDDPVLLQGLNPFLKQTVCFVDRILSFVQHCPTILQGRVFDSRANLSTHLANFSVIWKLDRSLHSTCKRSSQALRIQGAQVVAPTNLEIFWPNICLMRDI